MLPLFALIGVVSVAVAVVGIVEAGDTASTVAVSAGVALHALPVGMLVLTAQLALYASPAIGADSKQPGLVGVLPSPVTGSARFLQCQAELSLPRKCKRLAPGEA